MILAADNNSLLWIQMVEYKILLHRQLVVDVHSIYLEVFFSLVTQDLIMVDIWSTENKTSGSVV